MRNRAFPFDRRDGLIGIEHENTQKLTEKSNLDHTHKAHKEPMVDSKEISMHT